MIIGVIEGATRRIGKSQGFLGLLLRDIEIDCPVYGPNTPAMVTAWEPTPDELAALNAGAKIHVCIYGTTHPPINLSVGEEPEKN